ncbi:ribosome biogenesis GTPase [Spiroplasma sp. TIUS-1]|uniref:ribosome small subunit-dependent GTPase A n=1 Tax=Spiroplasma sp. TIUS-1 TaxID=216963 RepID=UPI00139892B2|nr:ribosome small subunit-dependent GTPase A [Spiroplasma sp. TIUS-1]QHX35770.1 ribosome biogenesis GTPase [Spiroplasma sp. TIUS-1]
MYRVISTSGKSCLVYKDGEFLQAGLQGKLLFNKQTVVAGDLVEVLTEGEISLISDVAKRKNELYRPRVSNVDNVVIVTSLTINDKDLFTLNKYIALVEVMGLEVILLFTKRDIVGSNDSILQFAEEYKKQGYKTFSISNMYDSKDFDDFLKTISTGLNIFTGMTGAGKSRTLNNILQNEVQRVQSVSEYTNKGKHTTTTSKLYNYADGYICDTPGFSSFDIQGVTKQQLAHSYKFFQKHINDCKFNDCLHTQETQGCYVVEAVNKNEFPMFIYEDYLKFLKEI